MYFEGEFGGYIIGKLGGIIIRSPFFKQIIGYLSESFVSKAAVPLDELLKRFGNLTEHEVKQLFDRLVKSEIKPINLVSKSAKSANLEFELDYIVAHVNPENFRPPYAKGSMIKEYELGNDALFVKVYSEDKYMAGEWLISVEDFKALEYNADNIRNAFALPTKPTKFALVKVPKGTQIREGIAGKIWDATNTQYQWGQGGGKQFQILNWDNIERLKKQSWFKPGGNL